ncbi:MAG: hypothetical protein HOG34_14940 [Bacteroidetes bacterium]|jgi:hypothetical protein|nr:hypothetical protein [Bacteroidota bacterium]
MIDSAYWLLSTIPQVFGALLAVVFILYNLHTNQIFSEIKTRGQKAINRMKEWASGVIDTQGRRDHFDKINNIELMLETKRFESFLDAMALQKKFFEQLNRPKIEIAQECEMACNHSKPFVKQYRDAESKFKKVVIVSILLIVLPLSVLGFLHDFSPRTLKIIVFLTVVLSVSMLVSIILTARKVLTRNY